MLIGYQNKVQLCFRPFASGAQVLHHIMWSCSVLCRQKIGITRPTSWFWWLGNPQPFESVTYTHQFNHHTVHSLLRLLSYCWHGDFHCIIAFWTPYHQVHHVPSKCRLNLHRSFANTVPEQSPTILQAIWEWCTSASPHNVVMQCTVPTQNQYYRIQQLIPVTGSPLILRPSHRQLPKQPSYGP